MPTDLTNDRGVRDSRRSARIDGAEGRGSETTYLTLSQVTRRFPPSRCGRPVHVATVTRWITEGARLRDGTRLSLRATRLPGRWVVEPEAVEEFLTALTADRSADLNAGRASIPAKSELRTAADRTTAARRKAHAEAARELDEIGIH